MSLEPKIVDWRKSAKDTDFDPDDTEMAETPRDVILALGFDPKELSEESVKASDAGADIQDAIRRESEELFQSAIDEFLIHAKADALAKKRKKRQEMDEIFLLLMTDSASESYKIVYTKLEKFNEAKNPMAAKEVAKAAEVYAGAREKFLKNFPDEVADKLAKVKDDAELADKTPAEVRKEVSKAAGAISEGQGKVVAETEAQVCYGSAVIAAIKRAGKTHKFWQTMQDDHVRHSHEQCQLQGTIPVGNMFHNLMLYPGDPNGAPEEIINCRCILFGVTK